MPLPTSSQRAAIADAVAAALTGAPGGTFVEPVTVAVRKYLPAAELEDLANLTVTVVPMGPEERSIASRGKTWRDFTVQVGVQRRLTQACAPDDPAGNPELDELALLTEQIAGYFEPDYGASPPRDGSLGTTAAVWVKTACDPLYDVDHLLSKRVFTGVVHLTFRRQ
jgi:hypothetical protein